jgi:predicted nucleic acid-binding protein
VPERQPVVIDTNILFSALLRRESPFTRLILETDLVFFICESTIVELFKHKDRIVQLSKLSEAEVIRLLYTLLRRIIVSKENLIEPQIRYDAYLLCADVDETDTPHVALTMHLNALLWTGDKRLKKGLQQKGFDQFFEPSR